MDLALVVALAATAVLLVVACVLLAVVLVGSRRAGRALEQSQAEVAALAARIEDVERARRVPVPVVPEAGFLITDVGTPGDDDPPEDDVRTQMVLSALVAEPLVKAVAFGYGVRRALSPQNRNRIRFEIRREVRRARKQRRRGARQAARQAARQSASQSASQAAA